MNNKQIFLEYVSIIEFKEIADFINLGTIATFYAQNGLEDTKEEHIKCLSKGLSDLGYAEECFRRALEFHEFYCRAKEGE